MEEEKHHKLQQLLREREYREKQDAERCVLIPIIQTLRLAMWSYMVDVVYDTHLGHYATSTCTVTCKCYVLWSPSDTSFAKK
jgi:hypothetical protein